MNIFNKPVVFKFYTDNRIVYECAKPKMAGAFTPDWFRQLPKPPSIVPAFSETIGSDYTNMRGCVGAKYLFKVGIVQPAWSDIQFDIGKIGTTRYKWSSPDSSLMVEVHSSDQYGDYWAEHRYQHAKIINPWACFCDEPIPVLLTDHYWGRNNQDKYTVCPGVAEFKYQHAMHINTFFNREVEDYATIIPFNQALLHFVPLTDRKIKIETHLVSSSFMEDAAKLALTKTTFHNAYHRFKRFLEQT